MICSHHLYHAPNSIPVLPRSLASDVHSIGHPPSLSVKQTMKYGSTLPCSDWPQSRRVDPARYINRPASLHCPTLCLSYWNIDFFTERRAHTEKSIFQCTQQNLRQSLDQLRGPASTAGRPWQRRGWGAGGDNAQGEVPPPTPANPEGSDKYASVQVARSPRINNWKEQGLIFP